MKKWILMASMMLAAGTMTACSEDEGSENPGGDATDDVGGDIDGGNDTDGDGDTVAPETCYQQDPDEASGIGVEVDGASDDGDMLCDAAEAGLSNSDGVACDTLADCDGDGINDDGEVLFRTDEVGGTGYATSPTNPNTDGVGNDDLVEDVEDGLDPTNPNDNVDEGDNTDPFDGLAYSYVSGIAIAGSDCCFSNLDGDAAIDNDLSVLLGSLGGVLASFAPDLDLSPAGIAELITPLLEEGDLTLLFEHTNAPADIAAGVAANVSVQPYLGELADDSSLAVRRDGDGQFFLGETVGTPFSSVISGGQFLVNSGALNLSLDLTELAADLLGGAELQLDLNVQKLRVRGDVVEQTKAGITDTLGVANTDGTSLEVGGALPLVELLGTLNGVLGECFGGEDLLVVDTESNDERIALACASPVPPITDTTALDGLCEDLADFTDLLCGGILDSVLGTNISIDTDDDGKADGLALGLLLELSGAADIVTPEPVIRD